jgi:hypothetical protein
MRDIEPHDVPAVQELIEPGRGYAERVTGEPKPYTYDKLQTTVRIWTRPLRREGDD